MTKKLNFPTLLFLFLHILSPVIAPAKTANKYGFTVYPSEWWHYDFHGGKTMILWIFPLRSC